MNFDCGIYAITSPSGKQYIGQAKSFKYRWSVHLRHLRRGKHHCKPLQYAYEKYGEKSMIFSKIAIVPEEQLNLREQEQFEERNRDSLYNVSVFAGAPMRGRKHTDKAKAAITAAQKGMKRTPEHRAKMSLAALKMTPEHKLAISAAKKGKPRPQTVIEALKKANLGRVHTIETRRKMSAAHAGIPKSPEHCLKLSTPVLCIETGQVFGSMTLAAEWLRAKGFINAGNDGISRVCSGKRASTYGYRWSYVTADHSGEDRNSFTTPTNPVTPEIAPCAADPTAVLALDQIEPVADSVTCAPEDSFDINAEYAVAACC